MRFSFAERVRKNSRRDDPKTSKIAGENIEASGQAEGQRQKCFWAVRNWPGMTAAEIAIKTNLERHVPSRRLPELRQAGLVINGAVRKCGIQKTFSMTWYVKARE